MKHKYEHVDAMRGIAILLVVFTHCGHFLPRGGYCWMASLFGQYGVQFFFVMSAFTLCHSIKKEAALSVPLYLAFMTRRFFRIAPLYYLAIPFYYAASWLWASDPKSLFAVPADYHWPAVAVNLLFLNGLTPFANNWVVPGGWSIGCEFLFYVIFPVLFFTFRADRRMLAVVAVASLAATLVLFTFCRRLNLDGYLGNGRFLYFFIVTQMPCFLLGMAYFFGADFAKGKRACVILILPALAVLLLTFAHPRGWLIAPILSGMIAVGLAVLLEKASIPRLLRQMGERSFSIYIFHFAVVQFTGTFFRTHLPVPWQNSLTAIPLFLVTAAVAFLIAGVTNKVIEQPFIEYGHAVAARIRGDREASPEAVTSR